MLKMKTKLENNVGMKMKKRRKKWIKMREKRWGGKIKVGINEWERERERERGRFCVNILRKLLQIKWWWWKYFERKKKKKKCCENSKHYEEKLFDEENWELKGIENREKEVCIKLSIYILWNWIELVKWES